MGSLFGKRKNEYKVEQTTDKKQKQVNDSRNLDSAESINKDQPDLSISPKPDVSTECKPKSKKSRHHRSQDLTGEARPHVQPIQPETKQPPVPMQRQMIGNDLRAKSQTSEDLSVHASICPPPPSKPPSIPNRETWNQSNDNQEHGDKYPNENLDCRPLEPDKVDSEDVYAAIESYPTKTVKAEYNYLSNYGSDISFSRGDIIQLIKESDVDGWLLAKNLTTGQEGYVIKSWFINTNSVDVESQKCYFKSLDRNAAEEKLLDPEFELGTYLLRPSGAGSYALSLRCQDKTGCLEIKHYSIPVVDKGICYIDSSSLSKPFRNIVELIEYYTEEPGLRCKLKTPLPQDAPLNDLAVKFSNLKLGEKLGSGNFGSVYAGTLNGNRQVAVKSLKAGGSMTVEQLRKEAEIMHKLRHPNLVSLLAICEERGKIHIITERMWRGSLFDVLRRNTVKFGDLMYMAIQVAGGMCYLERKRFVHRDLRASNVFVGDRNITKIAEFGLTKLLDNYYEGESFFKEKKGTVFPNKWTAPEAIKHDKFTVKSDVWSFGVLLYEMQTNGKEPYTGMTNPEALDWVENGDRLNRPKDCPLALYNIMKQCWLKNPGERPSFEYIKDNLVEIKGKW